MDDAYRALNAICETRERATDLFLQELVAQIALDVPSFDAQAFLDRLHVRQALLPTPDRSDLHDEAVLGQVLLAAWGRKVVLTEKALRDVEGIRDRTGES